MNTYQITRALKSNPVTRGNFCGVFPSDKLPTFIERFPCGIVVNSQPHNDPGEHWLAFYLSSEYRAEFFNSTGNRRTFIMRHLKNT